MNHAQERDRLRRELLRPLVRLTLPVPPGIEDVFGYDSDGRLVVFWHEESGDELAFADDRGHETLGGEWYAWRMFNDHPCILPHVQSFFFGATDAPAEHGLLLDRTARVMYAGRLPEIRAGLGRIASVGMTPMVMTDEDLNRVTENFRRACNQWDEERAVSRAAIEERIQRQQARLHQMLEWLNGLPCARSLPSDSRPLSSTAWCIGDDPGSPPDTSLCS